MTELRLAVEPPTPYYDEPFALPLEGVPEADTVAVAAEFRELDGSVWRSGGDHRVGADGRRRRRVRSGRRSRWS